VPGNCERHRVSPGSEAVWDDSKDLIMHPIETEMSVAAGGAVRVAVTRENPKCPAEKLLQIPKTNTR
jgi:hypothetical protein